jgi:hypothetical protein
MVTADERLQILKMIEEGKITPDEGARLLSALSSRTGSRRAGPTATSARWFRVRVSDTRTGRNKVNVSIPMGLVNVGVKMGARFIPEDADIDIQELFEQVRSGAQGKIFEAINEEDGEHVEIFIE